MMMVSLKRETMDTSQSDRVRAWAQETLTMLQSRPPASLIVTLHQLRHSRNRSLVRCFEKEYHFCQKFMQQHDMREGLMLKTDPSRRKQQQQPKWSPDNVFHLNPASMVSYFHPPSPREIRMLNSKDMMQYPFRHYKLPLEQEILKVAESMTVPENVVGYFQSLQPQKVGVFKKVMDVLSRKTRPPSVCL
jgi:3-hydroxyisobutyryl-CoA hydrolase